MRQVFIMSKPGKKVHDKVVFKEYDQSQLCLPIDLECLIPPNHMVRVVNSAIDQMDLGPLLAKYPGGGRSSYHPIMMTKLIIYAYADKIFSSRRIEKAARENIMYMWLCGGNTPDFKITFWMEPKLKPMRTNTAGYGVNPPNATKKS